MDFNYIGEIRMFAGNFAPYGWALCNGQLLPISQNTALFSILGTTYGGNGTSTFGLPNLQGTVPIQQGQGRGLTDYVLGELGGTPNYTLINSELPAHTHNLQILTTSGDSSASTNHIFGGSITDDGTGIPVYMPPPANAMLSPMAMTPSGSSMPHNNMQPYLCVSYIIALQGVFPPRG
jgi:microcystin-dependent protein